jgi:hypothetical protein
MEGPPSGGAPGVQNAHGVRRHEHRRPLVKVPTIRYYEQIGLLLPAARTGGVSGATVRTKSAASTSFGMPASWSSMSARSGSCSIWLRTRPCLREAHQITRARLDDVNGKIERLTTYCVSDEKQQEAVQNVTITICVVL